MAVFRVGGIDAVLDIPSAVIAAPVFLFSQPDDTVAFIITGLLMGIPIQYLQSINHWLVYNIDI